MKYYIEVKNRKFDREGDIAFQMYDADKDIVRDVLTIYGNASFTINICAVLDGASHKLNLNDDLLVGDFPIRIYNCLFRAGCRSIKDVLELYKSGKLYYVRNLGNKGIEEIKEILIKNNLVEEEHES